MKEENLNIEKQLEVLKSKEIFKVPENYFEDFSGRLKMRMEQEKRKPVRITWFESYLKPALSMVAVLAILLLAIYIPVHKTFTGERMNIAQSRQSHQTNQIQPASEQGDSYEALTMLPQSQFLSALEEVENQEDIAAIDPKALEEYLADNSSDYEIMTNN
jgi:type IV secretory pathway component VirB8